MSGLMRHFVLLRWFRAAAAFYPALSWAWTEPNVAFMCLHALASFWNTALLLNTVIFLHTCFPCSQLSQLWSSIQVSKRMFTSWMNQLEPPERVFECLTAVSSVSLSAAMHVFFIVRAHTLRAVEKASGIRLTSLLQRFRVHAHTRVHMDVASLRFKWDR